MQSNGKPLAIHIEELVLNNMLPLHLMPMYINNEFIPQNSSVEELVVMLQKRALRKRSHLEYRIIRDSDVYFSLKLRTRIIRGIFHISPSKEILYIILHKHGRTTNRPEDLKLVAKKLYPLIIAPIVHYRDIIMLLDILTKGYSIFILNYLLRKEILNPLYKKTKRRTTKRRTLKSWAGERYELIKRDILRSIKEEKSVLDVIMFRLLSEDGFFADIRLDRFGMISIYNAAPDVYSRLLRGLIEYLIEKSYYYLNQYEKVKIIDVDESSFDVVTGIYEFETLLDPKSDYKSLLETLRGPYYVSVHYFGNPWMDIDIVDSEDGSIFKLIVTEKNISIIPEYNVRPSSLQRLVDHLSSVAPGFFYPNTSTGGSNEQ